jgi:hypothetical protein
MSQILIVSFLLLLSNNVFSEPASNPLPLSPTDKVTPVPLLSSQELILSMAVLLFGVYAATLQYKLLSSAKSSADEALRTLAVTLIVVISLALVSSGYGKEQITPVLGLFGTIIGYLLGAARPRATKSKDSDDTDHLGAARPHTTRSNGHHIKK